MYTTPPPLPSSSIGYPGYTTQDLHTSVTLTTSPPTEKTTTEKHQTPGDNEVTGKVRKHSYVSYRPSFVNVVQIHRISSVRNLSNYIFRYYNRRRFKTSSTYSCFRRPMLKRYDDD